jgi:hypothetical protein
MKRQLDGFVWIGLGIALILALFLSPFTSTSPDGLEKVAETKGFAEKGETWKFWKHAPLSDYTIPWIKTEKVSTALSGLIGTSAIFFIALGFGKLIKKSPPVNPVRNSSGALNPALRGGTPYGAEPGIILKSNPAAEQRGIISNGVKRILSLLLFLLPLFSTSVFAAHPLITDDTGTQGKGRFQLEVNSEVNYDKESEAGVKTKTTGGEMGTIISYGIIDNVDIVLGVPYQWFKVKEDGETISREKGISDITLELKWRFYERDGWSFALKPGVTFPAGNEKKDLGTGRVTYSIFFITTKEIEPLAFHLNLGYMRNENKLDERKDMWHFSLASEVKLIKNLKVVANIGAERNPERVSHKHPAFILGGLIYSIVENFDVDIGIKGGLNKPETDVTILAGIAWRF